MKNPHRGSADHGRSPAFVLIPCYDTWNSSGVGNNPATEGPEQILKYLGRYPHS